MRLFTSTIPLICSAVFACGSERLTGPEAREAYHAVSTHLQTLPEGVLVFVDGRQVPAGEGLDLDPDEIVSIEVIRGAAAQQSYGAAAEHGVIRIVTARADSANEPRAGSERR